MVVEGGSPLGWEWIASYLVGGSYSAPSAVRFGHLLHTTPLFLIVGMFAVSLPALTAFIKSL